MPEPKTQRTKASVSAFIAAVENEQRRKDAKAVDKLMREVSGEKPAMWGAAIIGYGQYESSTGTWPRIGFSPRKANLVLYIMSSFKERDALLEKLGEHKTSKACLYINKLAETDEAVLRSLIKGAWKSMEAKYG